MTPDNELYAMQGHLTIAEGLLNLLFLAHTHEDDYENGLVTDVPAFGIALHLLREELAEARRRCTAAVKVCEGVNMPTKTLH